MRILKGMVLKCGKNVLKCSVKGIRATNLAECQLGLGQEKNQSG